MAKDLQDNNVNKYHAYSSFPMVLPFNNNNNMNHNSSSNKEIQEDYDEDDDILCSTPICSDCDSEESDNNNDIPLTIYAPGTKQKWYLPFPSNNDDNNLDFDHENLQQQQTDLFQSNNNINGVYRGINSKIYSEGIIRIRSNDKLKPSTIINQSDDLMNDGAVTLMGTDMDYDLNENKTNVYSEGNLNISGGLEGDIHTTLTQDMDMHMRMQFDFNTKSIQNNITLMGDHDTNSNYDDDIDCKRNYCNYNINITLMGNTSGALTQNQNMSFSDNNQLQLQPITLMGLGQISAPAPNNQLQHNAICDDCDDDDDDQDIDLIPHPQPYPQPPCKGVVMMNTINGNNINKQIMFQ